MMKKSMDDDVLRKKIIALLKEAGSPSSARDLTNAVRSMLKNLPPPIVKSAAQDPHEDKMSPARTKHPPLPAFLAAGSWSRAESEYLVIDLSTWGVRLVAEAPNLSDENCRTMELWLRRIPAGTFVMGGTFPEDIEIFNNELPAHKVTLSKDFYLGIFPVTRKQWELVMGPGDLFHDEDESGYPADQFSYNDICGKNRPWPYRKNASVTPDSFLGTLRARTGLEGLDLPTEAQWEYACRAGTTTEYSFGDSITPSQVNYRDSPTHSLEVGSYPPNAWGLYDMHGTVWEWCRDWYGKYTGKEENDPTGPSRPKYASDRARVVRGGSYRDGSLSCRSAVRNGFYPRAWEMNLGFRLALVPVR